MDYTRPLESQRLKLFCVCCMREGNSEAKIVDTRYTPPHTLPLPFSLHHSPLMSPSLAFLLPHYPYVSLSSYNPLSSLPPSCPILSCCILLNIVLLFPTHSLSFSSKNLIYMSRLLCCTTQRFTEVTYLCLD